MEDCLEGKIHFWSETGTEGGHWAFQDNKHISDEQWAYEGLHVLQSGDQLEIYDENNNPVWSGVINLHLYAVFTEHVRGFWIHADQVGMNREQWAEYFFNEYRARLTPNKKIDAVLRK